MKAVGAPHFTGLLMVAIAAAIGAPAKAQSSQSPPPVSAEVPLSTKQLGEIYGGKTWLWPDGAAYFAPGGRFSAWAGTGKKESFATGTWRTPGNGRLCFRAVWVSRGGAGGSESCYAHVSKSGFLFQRKEPAGEWYVFKHPTAQPEDEFRKLVPGDKAGAEVERIRGIFRRG
jgi:hypothetical protein